MTDEWLEWSEAHIELLRDWALQCILLHLAIQGRPISVREMTAEQREFTSTRTSRRMELNELLRHHRFPTETARRLCQAYVKYGEGDLEQILNISDTMELSEYYAFEPEEDLEDLSE